jgi:DNA topoisomerase-2
MDLSDKYRKQTHREHILSLPDTYIGSIETAEEEVWLPGTDGAFQPQRIAVNPGFYKLVDELLVNSHDQVVRLRQNKSTNLVKHIAVSYTDGILEVENDGESIDVAKHPEHDMYIPQLIFGELLTSTNYDKEEKKLVGGKNGYGVKLVNIFAKALQVRVVDAGRALLYEQTFTDNMTKVGAPKVKASKAKSSVGIRWQPDYARFGYPETGLPVDMVRLIERRVCDLAMTVGKEVKVTWNGTLIKCRSLTDYAKAYGGGATVVFEAPNERWQIALAPSQADHFFQSSFVNGIWTAKGGKHVDAVVDQVVGHMVEYLETKKKTKVRPGLVKEHLAVFIVSMIENPSFSSQTKEVLTTKASAFGSSCKLSEDTLKKVVSKLGIVETILAAQAVKDSKENTKTDGKKQSRITGIPKLDDAVMAGTKDSAKCTLILTEGDSAKAMALSGLSQEQRKVYGVYPLKGKVLNVKDTSDAKVEQTKEIAELKKILGLQSGKKYTDVSGLRYGSVMIMTDQDYDGSHIRGLLINLFHELWHELVAIPGFLTYMATPIVKATKGTAGTKGGADTKVFFSQYEYEQWRASPASKGYSVKYYKGLGTSTRDEAKGYFAKPQAVSFTFAPGSDEAIDLAFNKQRADDRKVWLQGYDKTSLVPAGVHVSYPEFIHKDLIHFSNYNLERALPSVMDGLKVSQRKILYAAFKRDLKHEIRVAQFAGYVSEHTGYHHGEQSLNDAIVGMAQDFMGSNNIPWLVPQGQFGTRLQGGKDSASPRYIHTYLQPNVRKIVPTEDFSVLKYRDDDGLPVEPEWYAPVLPMLLINGARGIGTGYSTYIPPCNPAQLKTMLVSWLRGDDTALDAPIKPYFKGFKGTVTDEGVVGVYRKEKDEFVVTELPPGTWTQEYREWLEKQLADGTIKDFVDTSTDTDVNIRIKGAEEKLIVKSLTEKIKHTNMHAFNPDGIVTKYDTPNAILSEYAEVRLSLYETRRQKLIADLKADLPYHEDVMRFIEDQIAERPTLDFRRKPKAMCEGELVAATYRKVSETYDYIFRLPVSAFTAEQVESHATKLANLRTEIARLESLEAADMWLHELSAV